MKRLIVLLTLVTLLTPSWGCRMLKGRLGGDSCATQQPQPLKQRLLPRLSLPWRRAKCESCGNDSIVDGDCPTCNNVDSHSGYAPLNGPIEAPMMMGPPAMGGTVMGGEPVFSGPVLDGPAVSGPLSGRVMPGSGPYASQVVSKTPLYDSNSVYGATLPVSVPQVGTVVEGLPVPVNGPEAGVVPGSYPRSVSH